LKFLGRARRFFQDLASEPEAKVQYFNVTCASGHRVRGERTEGYQALRCPACGEGVFVLPRSPLPEPVAPARSSAPKPAGMGQAWVEEGPVELTEAAGVSVETGERPGSTGDADIIWDDATAEAPPRPRPTRQRRPARSDDVPIAGPPAGAGVDEAAGALAPPGREPRPPGGKRPPPRRQAEPPEKRTARPAKPLPSEDDVRERTRRPHGRVPWPGAAESEQAAPGLAHQPADKRRALHRWLLVLVPLLVVATLILVYRRQRRQEYPEIAKRGRTEGITALEEGDFDRAYQLLSAAKSAVDGLGGAVEGAGDIRDAAEEAGIFNRLISETPESLLAELGRTDRLTWATRFEQLYKGRTIFVDSWITAVPGPDGSGGYDLAYRILPDGESRSFREGGDSRPDRVGAIDLAGFRLFELAHPKLGDRVIFGAALAAFEYDSDRNLYMIRLVPKSGVFITHTKALESIGWIEGTERTEAVKFPEDTE
jgi:hypothetical protein